jgi:hypothetical protein
MKPLGWYSCFFFTTRPDHAYKKGGPPESEPPFIFQFNVEIKCPAMGSFMDHMAEIRQCLEFEPLLSAADR